MPLPLYTPSSSSQKSISSDIRYIVAVASGKGGVGKSTVAVHLACALDALGYTVGLLDADLYGPSIRHMLPEDHLPYQKEDKILPALSGGLKLISAAYFRREDEAAILRAPLANRFISQFIQNVVWGKLDILLIDYPPGTGDIQLTLSQQANLSGSVIVTTPQEVALLDVRKAMDLFHKLHLPLLGVIENMSYYQPLPSDERIYLFGKGGGERLALTWGIPCLAEIPLDPEICRCGDSGRSLFSVDQERQKQSTLAYLQAARSLVKRLEAAEESATPAILKLYQMDSYTFGIEWRDGKKQTFRFSDLQRVCPCARCVDEISGERVVHPDQVLNDLSAKKMEKVGHYGIKIAFSAGCSTGIYHFDLLRLIGKEQT